MKPRMRKLTYGALIGALYVALTFISNAFGLANGVIQLRLSEALTVLPAFTSAAVPGLFVGCILANILTGCAVWDVVFGALATLLGALGTRALKNKWLSPIPPIAANTLIIPLVLQTVYGAKDALWLLSGTVFMGEFLSCGVLGILLYGLCKKHNLFK